MTHAKPLPPLSESEIARVAETVLAALGGLDGIAERAAAILYKKMAEQSTPGSYVGPEVRRILRAVSDSSGVPMCDLLGDRRSRTVAWPRQVAMYLALERTGLSLPAVGRALGERDHTTIMHGRKRVKARLASQERSTVALVNDVIARLDGPIIHQEAAE